ncbi:YitT family protein [Paraclostridium bifermentans]|uniref:YitT family protein n=1 Tax=Paraclostridium bifermentans TaxID=1490 RepID=A0A5P3XFJ4_PARBF|nr:YitT family protein [Paraclostridium bifermentans]MCU9810036.1 YitT family protein [Paraclostridium sp. AKS46]MDV8113877.1 YitT family protein [Bacillus sp. BAU-SS-2023]MCE9676880.1 YitT family protein [Paraclostridium bifermentans]QEZ69108.1 YitT family protein [Paraclostridium bifermentans]TQO59783.1 YitT family protein [Paraclostridium bifermentans]
MKKSDFIKGLQEYIVVTIGVILVAIGIQYFFAPNDIAGGGLSGLALIINHYVPSVSMGIIIFIGNLILFAISFILIGGDFGLKTIYASFMLSVVIDFMDKILNSTALTTNLLAAVIVGTLVTAIGLAMVFATNASTGGTDILAKILNKYTTFNIGISLLIVDLFVAIMGGFTFGLQKGIYSMLVIVLNGLLIDRVIEKIEKKKNIKEQENEEKLEEVA